MTELFGLLSQLSRDIKLIKPYLLNLYRKPLDDFKKRWIDGQDVMQLLHISKRTLQSLRDSNTLPYSRINGKFYYKLSDIENLLDENYSNQ